MGEVSLSGCAAPIDLFQMIQTSGSQSVSFKIGIKDFFFQLSMSKAFDSQGCDQMQIGMFAGISHVKHSLTDMSV